jgi:magnesium-protoporphyrin IX monomethyl ester (oxidative) cyclase
LFRFFESWCQDENRHGDFFAALLKSQKNLLNNIEAKLWCKFFLLSVFVTMYLNDCQRSNFYSSIGLDTRQFDKYVIKKTNQSAGTLFPIIYNTEDPKFFLLLDQCEKANCSLIESEKEDNFLKVLKKIPAYFSMISGLIQLYFLPDVETKYIWTE